jgi:hypothetical protein
VVQAPVTHRWSLAATSSRVVQLTVKAPSGATITVRCRGRGCAFKTRTLKASGAATQLAKLFKKRQLRKGAVVEVEVSVPGSVARLVRFTVIGRRKIPRSQQLCRQPGATSVQACG